jgi:hypothetical protein
MQLRSAIEFHAFAPLDALPCVRFNGMSRGVDIPLTAAPIHCDATLKVRLLPNNYCSSRHSSRWNNGSYAYGALLTMDSAVPCLGFPLLCPWILPLHTESSRRDTTVA